MTCMEETIQIAWKEVILLELAKGNPKLKEAVLCRRGAGRVYYTATL